MIGYHSKISCPPKYQKFFFFLQQKSTSALITTWHNVRRVQLCICKFNLKPRIHDSALTVGMGGSKIFYPQPTPLPKKMVGNGTPQFFVWKSNRLTFSQHNHKKLSGRGQISLASLNKESKTPKTLKMCY